MLAEGLGPALGVLGVVVLVRFGLLVPLWEAIKSGLYWIVVPGSRRTPLQAKYDTDLTWAQVRWSIARLEHELLAPDEWTHEDADCVHPACNPRFMRRIREGRMVVLPPPPRSSRGGHVSKVYTCRECGSKTDSSNDVLDDYCARCWSDYCVRLNGPSPRLSDPGNPQKI
jgi:hypothetical protein